MFWIHQYVTVKILLKTRRFDNSFSSISFLQSQSDWFFYYLLLTTHVKWLRFIFSNDHFAFRLTPLKSFRLINRNSFAFSDDILTLSLHILFWLLINVTRQLKFLVKLSSFIIFLRLVFSWWVTEGMYFFLSFWFNLLNARLLWFLRCLILWNLYVLLLFFWSLILAWIKCECVFSSRLPELRVFRKIWLGSVFEFN